MVKEKINFFLLNTLIFSAILLNNSFSSLLLQFLIFVFCLLSMSKYSISIDKIFFILSITISIILNFVNIEFKDLIRLIQIVIAFLFLPLNIEIAQISKKMLGLIMIFIALMAFSNVLELNFESTFKNNFYPIEVNPWASDYSFRDSGISILFNRYATFYYNPNILGQITLLILIIYLIKIHNVRRTFFDTIVFISGIFCLLVSGGRTSFLIFSIIVFLTVVWRMKIFFRYLFLVIIVPIIIVQLSESRLLQIFSKDDNMDSVGIKFAILESYIQTLKFDSISILRFFFGTMKSDIQFDNDIGSIFYFTGISSIVFFLIFFFREIWKVSRTNKPYYFFLLISISATIIFNFKFLILIVIIISLLSNNNVESHKKI